MKIYLCVDIHVWVYQTIHGPVIDVIGKVQGPCNDLSLKGHDVRVIYVII